MHRHRTRLLVAAAALGLVATGCMERNANPSPLGSPGTGRSATAMPGSDDSPETGSPTLDVTPDVTPGATPAPTQTAPRFSPASPEGSTPTPGDGWQEPLDPPPAEFLAVEELPSELGLGDATVQDNPTEDGDGKTWSLVDLYAYPAGNCAGDEDQAPAPSSIGWHSHLASSEAALFAGTTGAEGEPPALALLQGLSTPDDAAAVLAAKRAQVSACPPPGTLPLFDDAPPIVRLTTPDVGDEAVAWRQLVIYPEAFVMVHDTVWWRRGEHLGAVLVAWAPGSIPGARVPGEEPEETTERALRPRRVARRRRRGTHGRRARGRRCRAGRPPGRLTRSKPGPEVPGVTRGDAACHTRSLQ